MVETSTQGGGRPNLPMAGISQPKREEVLNLPRVHISSHPVMAHKMTALRDKNTQPPEFYRLVKEIGALLAYEATQSLALEPAPIETPMATMVGQRLAGGIGVTPILRAGLGLAEAFREVIPDIQVWHLGLRRDERIISCRIRLIYRWPTPSTRCWRRGDRPLMPSIYSNCAVFLASPMFVLSRRPMVCSNSPRCILTSTSSLQRLMSP